MTLYEELGLPKVINAAATLTKLGGSRMPAEVVAASASAMLAKALTPKIAP